jgi:hypothetical protein
VTTEFEWIADPEKVFPVMMNQYIVDIRAAIAAVLLRYEPEIETWLKTNAGWTDQTGNLRQSMWAEFQQVALDLQIAFDYDLDYGVFLELANSGAYAVTGPALDYFAPRIWADIQRLFA